MYTPFRGAFPLKLGFWGLESSWEKNLLYSLLCVTDHIAFFFCKALPSHGQVNCVTGLVTPRRQLLTFVEVQLQFVKARQGGCGTKSRVTVNNTVKLCSFVRAGPQRTQSRDYWTSELCV